MSMASTAEGFVIGVDIGGTKVAAGLVDREGKILFQARAPMVSDDGAAHGLSCVTTAIDLVSAKAPTFSGTPPKLIDGIGICAPGPLDPKTGAVINPPNLTCWRNFPLAAEVARLYRVPVKVDNDANAAGLAETLWGAGRGYRNVFYTTIGTGIGTGIVNDGRIYHGRTGAAGEGGHMTIDYNGPRCGCGKPGCVEALAAGPAIARRAREKLDAGRASAILDLARGNISAVTSEMVGKAYIAGDAVAREVLNETFDALAFWLGNIIDLLEPDVIIIGGGVGSMLKPYFSEISERLPRCSINQRCQEIPLLPAQYGEDAGVAGGAALCMESPAMISTHSTETFSKA
jgi:glucokinase